MCCARVARKSRFILGDSGSFHSMSDPNSSRKDTRSEKLGREEFEKVGQTRKFDEKFRRELG
jgi:hypothetical protein